MPIYVCEKCNWTTTYADRMTRHLNKKKLCRNELIIVDRPKMEIIKKVGVEVGADFIREMCLS
jgi:hypothetical protein